MLKVKVKLKLKVKVNLRIPSQITALFYLYMNLKRLILPQYRYYTNI